MYNSLLRVSPNFKLWILCFDDTTYRLLSQMNLKNVELLSLDEFEDDDLKKAKQNRTPVEYFWTCTPSLPLFLLKKYPHLPIITYIDADLYFYSDPEPIFEEFGDRSILLIEHRYAKDAEHKTKNNGIYNVQFITFRNNATGKEALLWWREKCIEWCYRRAEDGKMGDQKYLDDWPQRFQNTCILQNKGAGLAPWNIINYELKQAGCKIFVDDNELIFYHFHFFKMYSSTLFNLSTYDLSSVHKQLVYRPYIKSIREAINYVRQFDHSFNRGYSSFSLDSIKESAWLFMSILRGNFCYLPSSRCKQKQ
ncbi:MAG: glycosyl transferase [Phycisphaerae bacterium]|nr:glycosyl transferase [Phycisphaerae bacterium]